MEKRFSVLAFLAVVLISGVGAFAPVEQEIDEKNPIEQYRNSFVLDEGTIKLDKSLQNIPYTSVSEVYWGEDEFPKKIIFKDFRVKENLGIDILSNELLVSAAKEFLKKYPELGIDVNNLEAIDVYAGSEFFSTASVSPTPTPSPTTSPSPSSTVSPTTNVYPSQELATVFFKEFLVDGNGQKRYVAGSFVNIVFKIGSDGIKRIVAFKGNYYSEVSIIPTSSILSEEDAVESARTYLGSIDEGYLTLNKESIKLVFYPVNNGKNLILAYEILFEEKNVKGYPEQYAFIIGAEFGRALNFYNTLQYVQVSGRVSGSVYPEGQGEGQKDDIGFKDNFVWVKGSRGEQRTITGENGHYSSSVDNPIEIRSQLEGPWVIVRDAVTKKTSSMKRPFSEGTNINWKNYDDSNSQEQSNVFYHTNLVHDFAIQPHINADMNFQTAAKVNYNCQGDYGAYYDPIDRALEFCGSAEISLFSSVIYHEYGHNIFNSLTQGLSLWGEIAGISEGIGDYTAYTLRDLQGVKDPACLLDKDDHCLRRGDNDKKYFGGLDYHPGEFMANAHPLGEIISGFLWHLREKFINELEREKGIQAADSLAYNALRLKPTSSNDYIEDLFITDDDNENLEDGTPNIVEICGSAAKHGFSLRTCEGATVPIAELFSPQLHRKSSNSNLGYDGYIHDDVQDIIGTALPAYNTPFEYWTLELKDLDDINSAPIISIKNTNSVKEGILVNNFDFSKLITGHKYRLKLEAFSGNEPFLSSSAQITFIKSHKATVLLTERKQASSNSNGVYTIYLRGSSTTARLEYSWGAGLIDYTSCKEGEGICVHTINFEALSDEGDLIFNFFKSEGQDNILVTRYLFLKKYSYQTQQIGIDFNQASDISSNLQEILEKRNMEISRSNLVIASSNSIFLSDSYPVSVGKFFYGILDLIPLHLYSEQGLFFNDYTLMNTFLAKNAEDNRILHLIDIMKYPFSSNTINFDESKFNSVSLSLFSPFISPSFLRIFYNINQIPFDSFLGSYYGNNYLFEFFPEVNELGVNYYPSGNADSEGLFYVIKRFYLLNFKTPATKLSFFSEPFSLNLDISKDSKKMEGYVTDGAGERFIDAYNMGSLKITLPDGTVENIINTGIADYAFKIDCSPDLDFSFPEILKDKKFCRPGKYKIDWTFGDTNGDGIGDIFKDGRILQLKATYYFDGANFIMDGMEQKPFIRGDANNDGKVDLSDAIYILQMLFQQGELMKCLDAGDVNDDGFIDISDPIYILLYLFNAGKEPPAPFSEAGVDATEDGLYCQ